MHSLFEVEPLSETLAKDINAPIDSIEQLTRSLDRLENFKDYIYLYVLKKDLMKKQEDIERDHFLMHRFPSMKI